MMYARVIMAHAPIEAFDGAVRFAQEQLPAVGRQPGFKGFYLLTDAGLGKYLAISLWETEEHMHAGEAQAARLRSQAAQTVGMTGLLAENYEVTMIA
jgi:heme-degrading monooxygenase HmoA